MSKSGVEHLAQHPGWKTRTKRKKVSPKPQGVCIRCGARLDLPENQPTDAEKANKSFADRYCKMCLAQRPTAEPIIEVPANRDLESDNWDRMTDNVLNTALSGLLPFLQHHSAETLATALLERLSTHLKTELHFIRTGKDSDGLGEYTSVQTFRDKFLAMGGIKK
jgi:hypothetical protein